MSGTAHVTGPALGRPLVYMLGAPNLRNFDKVPSMDPWFYNVLVGDKCVYSLQNHQGGQGQTAQMDHRWGRHVMENKGTKSALGVGYRCLKFFRLPKDDCMWLIMAKVGLQESSAPAFFCVFFFGLASEHANGPRIVTMQ